MDFISTDMFIGAYWPARKESREEATARIIAFLEAISTYRSFAKWYESADRRAPISLDAATIAGKLKTNHDDAERRIIPELGYSLALLTWESTSGGVLFSTLIGSYHHGILNNTLLNLSTIPITEDVACSVFQTMIRVFEPEHAAITSNEIIDAANAEDPWEAGWLIYERGKDIREG